MKKAKLGTGARFKALEKKLSKSGTSTDVAAVAASIGRKKFGNERFQHLAEMGKKKKSK